MRVSRTGFMSMIPKIAEMIQACWVNTKLVDARDSAII
jgi:hypothetical protein